jgi:hypothetical protein
MMFKTDVFVKDQRLKGLVRNFPLKAILGTCPLGRNIWLSEKESAMFLALIKEVADDGYAR